MFTAIWVVTGVWKAWRELSPKHMQMLQRNYLTRKLGLHRALQQTYRFHRGATSDAEVSAYQKEVLDLIASYVRDFRRDRSGTEIFVNLIGRDDDHMVVVNRNYPHRKDSQPTPRNASLAWKAMRTGDWQVIGDLYRELPLTPPGKPYRSILAIPVYLGDRVVGVVSIDSAKAYHFDSTARDLVSYLTPYVALLAWTLDPEHIMATSDPGPGGPKRGKRR